ncbi:MAG: ATP-binding cassette domain-containing protein [Candidatus Omnitrophica bacterium]|nr:ATP-binding cassette domain-containing protein [Candidatus Omnitrophota bacterium]
MNYSTSEAVIVLDSVNVEYGYHQALHQVSLCVLANSCVTIAGPNGAGKTTLLASILGLCQIRTGLVKVLGRDLRDSPKFIRKHTGYVPQNVGIDPQIPLLVWDVISFGRLAHSSLFHNFSKKDKETIEEAAELVGIRHLLNRPFGYLSAGEQRKVALARVLAQQPKLLLLDEPLANLDLPAQAMLLELIDKIKSEKELTILLVSHDLTLLPKSCNQIVLMKKGRVILSASKEVALREDVLSNLYDCPVKVVPYKQRGAIFVEGKS